MIAHYIKKSYPLNFDSKFLQEKSNFRSHRTIRLTLTEIIFSVSEIHQYCLISTCKLGWQVLDCKLEI